MEEINSTEKQLLLNAVSHVWKSIKNRCKTKKLDETNTSAALYTIQDFIGNINVDEDGVDGKMPI